LEVDFDGNLAEVELDVSGQERCLVASEPLVGFQQRAELLDDAFCEPPVGLGPVVAL